jgi:hypothetical protein
VYGNLSSTSFEAHWNEILFSAFFGRDSCEMQWGDWSNGDGGGGATTKLQVKVEVAFK